MLPAFRIEAVNHHDLASATKLFNVHEADYHLFVHIPVEVSRNYALYEIEEVSGNVSKPYSLDFVSHDRGHPWYRLISDVMNKEIGHHTYKMSFVNKQTDEVCSLYFAYVIQSNNPDKPYVYMDRGDRS